MTSLCTSRKWEQHGTAPHYKGADASPPSQPCSKVTSSAKPALTPHDSSSVLGFAEAPHTPRSEPSSEDCLHTRLPIDYGVLKTGDLLPLPVQPWDNTQQRWCQGEGEEGEEEENDRGDSRRRPEAVTPVG